MPSSLAWMLDSLLHLTSTAYLLYASSLLGQEFNSEHKYHPECVLKDILNMFENSLKNTELDG